MRPRRSPRRQTTLRDVQRGMARQERSYYVGDSLQDLGVSGSGWELSTPEHYLRYQPMIDRLVAQYGPNMLIKHLSDAAPLTSGDERKKETDEVAPATSRTSNEKHGGDGASGEVPEGHSTKGENADADSRQVGDQPPSQDDRATSKEKDGGSSELEKQSDQGTAGQSAKSGRRQDLPCAEETGQQSTPQASSEEAAHGPTVAQDSAVSFPSLAAGQQANGGEREVVKDAEKKDSSEAGKDESSADRTIREDDKPLSDGEQAKQIGETSEDVSEIPSSRTLQKALQKAEKAERNSRQGRAAYGGIFAELERQKIDRKIVTQARTVLSAWMADGADDEQSQRWDYPELASRLLTRRDPRPAKRYEHGRPGLLILADVSGSCSGFSNQSLLVAQAIAALGTVGADVVIVSHSNGCPDSVSVNNRPQPQLLKSLSRDYYNARAYLGFYRDLAARYSISHVIALGDHDAVEIYAMLATSPEVQSFIWLDNYGCNNHAPRRDRPNTSAAARSAIHYVIGCKGAPEFLRGLKIAIGQ